MEREAQARLYAALSTLLKPQCLAIVGSLIVSERSAAELTDSLRLKSSELLQHMKLLANAGLIERVHSGGRYVYRPKGDILEHLRNEVDQILRPAPRPDHRPESTGNLDGFVRGDRLLRIPKRESRLNPILQWLASQFEYGRTYDEAEVNDVLQRYHPDYCRLRRELVVHGYLKRDDSGKTYWRDKLG